MTTVIHTNEWIPYSTSSFSGGFCMACGKGHGHIKIHHWDREGKRWIDSETVIECDCEKRRKTKRNNG